MSIEVPREEVEKLRKKLEEEKAREVKAVIEEFIEGRVVRVLAPNGTFMNAFGSFIDLGDYVVVAESTLAYLQEISGEDVLEGIRPVGVAVIYKKDGDILTPVDRIMYYPSIQNEIQIQGKLIILRGDSRELKADYYIPTLPDVNTLIKVRRGEELSISWDDVGSRIVNSLRDYIVLDDERQYDVVASYIVMTYFYDVFTAVPFLWLYGPPGSGKTRANITITYMCRRGLFIADPTDATLYRVVEMLGPTLGIDESVLTIRGKRILAAGYKKGAVVPRAEPTRKGILLKFFEATAPRIFSFEDQPNEDYLLQRTVLINMLKARPRKFLDPLPNEFKDIRESLYYLRLTALPQIVEVRGKALKVLEDNGVWGREAELWAPILTAAILINRDASVLHYIVEDIASRKSSELIYNEEKMVLAAIEGLFSKATSLTDEGKISFMARDVSREIIRILLREENCLEVQTSEVGNGLLREEEVLKADKRCMELERELMRRWSPQRVGKVIRNLGFDKFKRTVGKGREARRVYMIKYEDFTAVAERYDYEPMSSKEGNTS